MKFIVRTNCEYSIEVEASNADQAYDVAMEMDLQEDWQQAWAPAGIEPVWENAQPKAEGGEPSGK